MLTRINQNFTSDHPHHIFSMRFFLHLLIASLIRCLGARRRSDIFKGGASTFSDRCFQCHGPDEANREADYDSMCLISSIAIGMLCRSSRREIPLLVSFGNASQFRSGFSDAPSRFPAGSIEPEESNTIKAWIEQGAEWGKHWSFEPITAMSRAGDHTASIDFFIDQRAKQMGLEMNPIAQPSQRLRRLSLHQVRSD